MELTFERLDLEVREGRRATSTSARGALTERRSLAITLEARGGLRGRGEAAPLPGFSTESLDEVIDAARGLDPSRLDASGHPWGWSIEVGPPSLRFALETAMLDARSQLEGRSVVGLLGGDPRRRVPVNGLVDRLGLEGERLAWSWVRRGVRTLKIKVGRPGREAEELQLLDRIWNQTSARVRLDANGRSGSKLAAWVRARAGRGSRFEYVEDPGPTGPGAPVPRGLDEELRTDPGAEIARDVRALVAKPTLWGGYGPVARLAARARAAGVGFVVTHTLEIGPGFDAAVAIGIALGTAGLAQGLAPHGFLLPGPRPHRFLQGWLRWRDATR